MSWRPTTRKRGGFFGAGIALLLFATIIPAPDVSQCNADSSIESYDELERCVNEKLSFLNIIKWIFNLGIIFSLIGIYRAIGYVDN